MVTRNSELFDAFGCKVAADNPATPDRLKPDVTFDHQGAVNFDIQYVEGKETLHPVKKDKSAIGSGTFQPKVAQDYCLVWTNLAKRPVNLSFEFARVNN